MIHQLNHHQLVLCNTDLMSSLGQVECMALQAKGHEMEVMAREKALAEALAAPVSACLFNLLT